MPHLTLDIEELAGPIMTVGVGVSDPLRSILADSGKPVPPIQHARALIDTGASCSVIDARVIAPLAISPVSSTPMHTPSTSGSPVHCPVYDLSIWLYHAPSELVWRRSFPVVCADLGLPGMDMLIGRDVLAHCLMVFDGPARRFTLAF